MTPDPDAKPPAPDVASTASEPGKGVALGTPTASSNDSTSAPRSDSLAPPSSDSPVAPPSDSLAPPSNDSPAPASTNESAAASTKRQGPVSRKEPFLRRLRHSGHDEEGFHAPKVQTWFKLGVATIAVLAIVPFAAPQWSQITERLATVASLVFLVAAVGLWLGLGKRAFIVATALVLFVFGLTSWTVFAFSLDDFFVIGLLAGFFVFALAGFNLVFILEEVVYDIDVRLHVRGQAWKAIPTMLAVGLAVGLPVLARQGGPEFPLLWGAAVAAAVLLAAWWFLTLVNHLDGSTVLRELHLFTFGGLLATAVAESVPYLDRLHQFPGIVPSLAVYLVLIGSWVYASYTTLQRTHFLLRGDNAAPWVAILLGASMSVLAHAQVLFAQRGQDAVVDLADRRIGYLTAGIWLGLGFYVLRSLARILAFLRETRGLGVRGRRVADQASQIADTIEGGTERALAGAAEAFLRGLDQALPGQRAPPRDEDDTGWELDEDRRMRRMP